MNPENIETQQFILQTARRIEVDEEQEAAEAVQDPALKKSLEDLQATREPITSQLAAATAASLTAWQPVFLKTFEATRNVK